MAIVPFSLHVRIGQNRFVGERIIRFRRISELIFNIVYEPDRSHLHAVFVQMIIGVVKPFFIQQVIFDIADERKPQFCFYKAIKTRQFFRFFKRDRPRVHRRKRIIDSRALLLQLFGVSVDKVYEIRGKQLPVEHDRIIHVHAVRHDIIGTGVIFQIAAFVEGRACVNAAARRRRALFVQGKFFGRIADIARRKRAFRFP